MTTFEDAKTIVASHRASEYSAEADFQVAPWGYETEDRWIIISGSWPEIYGYRDEDDLKYISTGDGPRCSVDKTTGDYFEEWGLLEPLAGATEIGERPEVSLSPHLDYFEG